MKSDFRSETFKKIQLTLFSFIVYNLMFGCTERNTKNHPTRAFEQMNEEAQNKI